MYYSLLVNSINPSQIPVCNIYQVKLNLYSLEGEEKGRLQEVHSFGSQ